MKIRVTGPESSGKSTLARCLAWCLDGIYVAEASRQYLHDRGGRYDYGDLLSIWQRQRAAEYLVAPEGASWVVCDTGPEVIQIWSEFKYGRVDPLITAATQLHDYDLTLLCAPDLPWVSDPLREHPDPDMRTRLFDRYLEVMPEACVIAGDHRVAQALAIIGQCSGSV